MPDLGMPLNRPRRCTTIRRVVTQQHDQLDVVICGILIMLPSFRDFSVHHLTRGPRFKSAGRSLTSLPHESRKRL